MTDGHGRSATTDRFEYDDDLLSALVVTHRPTLRPVVGPERDVSVLVYGEVYSRERDEGYERRPTGTSTSVYCGRAFAEDGIEALTQLNGEFVCIVVDHARRIVRIVTDRLGSQPVYHYTRNGSVFFSTSIQALASHPSVRTGFEPSYLAEYLARKSVRGVRTPLAGIEQLPPATVTTIDPDSGSIERERYWQPVHRPDERPFGTFVDLFIDRFMAALDDRIRPNRRHGLLLSGGSDSRLILAAMESIHAYGFDDGSTDVETATRVARRAGVAFTRLDGGRISTDACSSETPSTGTSSAGSTRATRSDTRRRCATGSMHSSRGCTPTYCSRGGRRQLSGCRFPADRSGCRSNGRSRAARRISEPDRGERRRTSTPPPSTGRFSIGTYSGRIASGITASTTRRSRRWLDAASGIR
ncbi:asparagine synthetase B family protein [Halalkalicoccus salilacus]|uniref:hypothetical protein n=1 Tax=Halalkalicoccus sp. GCM10025704 TaxID=3252662 RepID=UPI00360BA6E0